jgi:hypothetical protein
VGAWKSDVSGIKNPVLVNTVPLDQQHRTKRTRKGNPGPFSLTAVESDAAEYSSLDAATGPFAIETIPLDQ